MRRSIALCWKGLRSYCTDAGDGFQSSKLKIFDRHLKRVQRDRAAWLMKPKDSLVDTVAENLLDRLEVFSLNFLFLSTSFSSATIFTFSVKYLAYECMYVSTILQNVNVCIFCPHSFLLWI
ncbi:putative methyltransferase [Nicotiana attenuata]|uniref:Methyltransferase n=1 Tax=Nicotiana attenuata TaxID=49451 RepID=A0A314LH04_NICAT|nr:putative methyltransferase [Nicotiana attenuata]